MVLAEQKCARRYDIRIEKTNIDQVNEIKYLGIIFNDKLSWKIMHNMSQPTMLCRARMGPARAARTGPVPIWPRAL